MRYSIAALIVQIVALLVGLVALGLAGYVFYYDYEWYKIVVFRGHPYFKQFLKNTIDESKTNKDDSYPQGDTFRNTNGMRTSPPNSYGGNFLRFPKTAGIVYLALLIFICLIQIVAVIITIVRKVRFLPQPCRENGCWYIIIGLLCVIAGIIEIQSRISIDNFYKSFESETNQADANSNIGATMLVSYGGLKNNEKFESKLSATQKHEREELFVCQKFTFFIASVTCILACGALCFAVAIILCCFWRKKTNRERADAESIQEESRRLEEQERNKGKRKSKRRCCKGKNKKKQEKSKSRSKEKTTKKSKNKNPRKNTNRNHGDAVDTNQNEITSNYSSIISSLEPSYSTDEPAFASSSTVKVDSARNTVDGMTYYEEQNYSESK